MMNDIYLEQLNQAIYIYRTNWDQNYVYQIHTFVCRLNPLLFLPRQKQDW